MKHTLTIKDIFEIHGYAVNISINTPAEFKLRKKPQDFMSYCWLMGTYGWLRSKNYIDLDIDFNDLA